MNPTIFCQQQLLLALPKFLSKTYFGKAIRAARPELEYPCWLCRTGQFRTHCLPRVGSNYHTVLMGLGISFFLAFFTGGIVGVFFAVKGQIAFRINCQVFCYLGIMLVWHF